MRIHSIEMLWNPTVVPSEEEYLWLRSIDKKQFFTHLAQKNRELRRDYNSQNPYQWRPVLIGFGVGIGIFLFGGIVKSEAILGVGALVVFFALFASVSTFLSRDYSTAYRGQKRYFVSCWQAAQIYDYPIFVKFVERKLLGIYI
ncbi:MAG: hypothetical protein WAW39_22800 [Prosthecobacter sp.]|uniref:hypothetical protein n=1 Tax=Prosthecobacter sp. TaxID=1965333 RepID=UPI003BB03BE5